MNWSLSFCMTLATLSTTPQEAVSSQQDIPPISKDVLEFIQSLENPEKTDQQKCSYRSTSPLSSSIVDVKREKLFLFTTLSMPLESWKSHSFFLQKVGGCFVLQGLPDNSFSSLSQKIQELREAGVHAEILLDPPAFEKYKIQAVPTIVFDDGEQYDKIAGNIALPSALNIFAKSGETHQSAAELLKQLEAH